MEETMTLWARQDVQSLHVPVSSGGCGQAHNRGTDLDGYPALEFPVTCAGCENFLKGGGRTELRRLPGDRDMGIAPDLERVAVIDPLWAASPEEVPPTHSEVLRQRRLKGKVLGNQSRGLTDAVSRMLNASSSGKSLTRALGVGAGVIMCPDSHSNSPGNAFCSQCGKRLGAAAISA